MRGVPPPRRGEEERSRGVVPLGASIDYVDLRDAFVDSRCRAQLTMIFGV